VLPCMVALDKVEKIIDPRREAHALFHLSQGER